MINETQELVFKLIEKGSFNNFSGPSVVRDLREHRDLWRSVLMKRGGDGDLISLRNLPDDRYSADTLFIYSEPGQQGRLEELATIWNADEAHWMCGEEAFRAMGKSLRFSKEFTSADRVIYVLWWD